MLQNHSAPELESTLISLEKGTHAFIVPSGTNAIALVLMAFARPNKRFLIADGVYDKTRQFCNSVLEPSGVRITYYQSNIGADINELICPDTTLIFCESPASWTFEIQDIPAITSVAKQHDIVVVTDNSWATPLFCNPIQLGADVVIHALSKYILGGEGLTLGAIITNDKTYAPIKSKIDAFGLDSWPSQYASNLALSGFETLATRLTQHQKSTLEVMNWLKEREEIAKIFHPIHDSLQYFQLWKRDFLGCNGLFSMLIHKRYRHNLHAFINALKMFKHSYGWGGAHSLIREAEERNVIRNNPPLDVQHLIRVSIGLEKTGHLIEDLKQAFSYLKS